MSAHLVNLSLQIIPINTTKTYPIIDAAIAVIQQSGIKYEVQPFATIMEGTLNKVMETAMAAKSAALSAGAEELVVNMQLHLKKDRDVRFGDKTDKF